MFTGIKERGKLLLVLLFSAACLLNACGGGGGGDGPTPVVNNNMQGVWNGNTSTQAFGDLSTTFTFSQDGNNLGGKLQVTDNYTTFDETDDVTGSVNNSEVIISAIFNYQDGTKIELGYKGSAEGNTISGKTDVFRALSADVSR
jgi:hypothetical protein